MSTIAVIFVIIVAENQRTDADTLSRVHLTAAPYAPLRAAVNPSKVPVSLPPRINDTTQVIFNVLIEDLLRMETFVVMTP